MARAAIREEVRRVLAGSAGYRELSDVQRKQLERDMSRVASYIAGTDDPRAASAAVARLLAPPDVSRAATVEADLQRAVRDRGSQRVLDGVDVPGFVAELIRGTFQASVDASIQQMKAYAELVRSVATSLEQFVAEQDDDDDD